jgi:glutamate-1-semialdehyde aminotransferase
MSDLFLNEDFEIEIGDGGQLKTVSGVERVKQSIAVHIMEEVSGSIGEVRNQKRFLRMSVRRVLKNHSLIDEINDLTISTEGAGGVYKVKIDFGVSSLSFEVSE